MAISKKVRQLVYAKYDGHCAYCGKEIDYSDMQVDHIYPKYRYNLLKAEAEKNPLLAERSGFPKDIDDFSNLNPSCRMCNFRKSEWTVDQFREEIRHQAKGVMKSFQARMSEVYHLIQLTDHPIKFYFEIWEENKKEAQNEKDMR